MWLLSNAVRIILIPYSTALCWKYLMPLALVNLVLMTVVVALGLYIK